MPFSQYSSQSSNQSCTRELSRETVPNVATIQATIPDFSQEQCIGIHGLMTAFSMAFNDVFDQYDQRLNDWFDQRFGPLPPTSSTQPITVKIKRNLKTRQQYKRRKAQINVTVPSQEVNQSDAEEVDQSDVQEVEHHAAEREDSKHVFLLRSQRDWSTCCWHAAAIQSEVLLDGVIMIGRWTNGRRRMGVG